MIYQPLAFTMNNEQNKLCPMCNAELHHFPPQKYNPHNTYQCTTEPCFSEFIYLKSHNNFNLIKSSYYYDNILVNCDYTQKLISIFSPNHEKIEVKEVLKFPINKQNLIYKINSYLLFI